ncbi:MAG TPA: AmmeMemoRadiSam system protein A [Candidatus Krumholzibacteria bacterium]|nr:AmmeMemoRadiSam system protein A [Candidatus Krumholzibacteria bacterium]
MTFAREADRLALTRLARAAIAGALGVAADPPPDAPILDARRGAFVTLTLRRALRGCVGRALADERVRLVVPAMARAAAFEDPRFPPLTSGELASVSIAVSLLSPPVAVSSPEEVRVGTHGVIVRAGGHRGLLLPQVAVEWNWTREELLGHACEKAALDRDAWRRASTRIEVFTAEVFGEEDR